MVETQITATIDQALANVHQGLDYLISHPIDHEDQQDALVFLGDALQALNLSKNLSQNGYTAGPFLANISLEIQREKEGLQKEPSLEERMLANYLDAAI